METTATALVWADQAPALFRPEYVEQLRAEAAKADSQYRYWLRQDMGR